jgi:hypothetical protein
MKQSQRLKKGIAILILLTAIGLPLACTTNNSSSPTTPALATHTPTPGGPTATFTTTLVPGATPTFTPTFVATPVFLNNYGVSAHPNGMYYDSGTQILYVATGVTGSPGNVTMFWSFAVGGGVLSGGARGNQFVTGFPTPQPPPPTPGITPAWQGTTLVSNDPQGYAEATNGANTYYGMLDSTATGAATLYEGCNGFNIGAVPLGASQYPTNTDGFDGIAFSSPRAIAGDALGHFYVADTANGLIDEFAAVCAAGPPPDPAWLHNWDGSSSGKPFIKPVAVVCDSSNNVYIGDAGYSPSIVEEWSSDGDSVIGMWTLKTNCVINGMALDNNGDFYVTDTANGGQVEEYKMNSSTSASLLRSWGYLSGTSTEPKAFVPSSIALIMTGTTLDNIVVGDNGNNYLKMLGP